jgi:hypothetical protein
LRTVISILLISLLVSVSLLPSGYGYWKKSLVFTGNIVEVQQTQPLHFTKITGGGKQSGNSFGFNFSAFKTDLNVQLEYNDHNPETDIKKIKVNDNSATNIKEIRDDGGAVIGVQFDVAGVVSFESSDKNPIVNLHIKVVDRGEPGEKDEFELKITNGQFEGYSSGNDKIKSGNIEIHGSKKKGEAEKTPVKEEKVSDTKVEKQKEEIISEETESSQKENPKDEQIPEESKVEEKTVEQPAPAKEETPVKQSKNAEQQSNDGGSGQNNKTSSENKNDN